ncbi:MAG: hypothetical protein HOP95_12030 [Sphingomonas sp.]|nr:hypothetical protein [Sphingomonas sp.]
MPGIGCEADPGWCGIGMFIEPDARGDGCPAIGMVIGIDWAAAGAFRVCCADLG